MKTTCDLVDEFGPTLMMLPYGLRSYGGLDRFHGPVETVKCFEDNSRIKELGQIPGEGKVLVVDAAGSLNRAVLGDMIAGSLQQSKWAGIIIWGAVRDVEELASLDLGVLALGHVPRPGIRRGDGQVGIPLQIGEAQIEPGCYAVADPDGVVLFPKDGPRPEA